MIPCLFFGCATSDIFQPLGENISSPNGMVIDTVNNRLYLVNSNSNVLYDWTQGSIQIYDITNPLSPVLMNTVATDSFSGEAILDQGRQLLYVTNRFSESTTDVEDHLLIMNTNEASADFTTVSSIIVDKDPYALYCCYPADRMWIVTEDNKLDYRDLADLSGSYIDLTTDLSNGGELTQVETSYIAVNNNQAYLPRIRGGLIIVNLDEAGDSTKVPVDYFISDIRVPNGVAADGTYVYLVDEETIDGDYTPLLLVLDLSSLTPLTDNTTTQVYDKEDDNLLVTQIEVGERPQRVFLTSQYAWVTCWEDDIVSVIDLNTRQLVTNIAVGEEPFNMALYAPGGVEKYLFVGNIESNTLSIIDIATLAVIATYP